MQIEILTPIMTIDGREMETAPTLQAPEAKKVKFGDVMVQALLTDDQTEKLEGAEKLARWTLAQKIQTAMTEGHVSVDVTTDDAVKIKKLIGKYMTTTVAGQIWASIDPSPKTMQ